MNIFDYICGCRHRNLSRVWTLRPTKRARNNWPEQKGNPRTYVVCFDCSRELSYDWQEMKLTSTKDEQKVVAAVGDIESQR